MESNLIKENYNVIKHLKNGNTVIFFVACMKNEDSTNLEFVSVPVTLASGFSDEFELQQGRINSEYVNYGLVEQFVLGSVLQEKNEEIDIILVSPFFLDHVITDEELSGGRFLEPIVLGSSKVN